MTPPLAVDIDGTLTRPDGTIDPRTLDPLRDWEAPVVIATGKALPYPVALTHFVGIPARIIAENGGISIVDDEVIVHGDREAADAVVADFEAAGYDLGWGEADLVNRWRETEIAISRDVPLDELSSIASDHGLEVVDTGYAYHVKSPTLSKGAALESVAERMGKSPSEFVAIGDSENDVEIFETVGRAIAVGNADELATAAADAITEGHYADGFLEALDGLR